MIYDNLGDGGNPVMMGDSLYNFVSGLGTAKDKSSYNQFGHVLYSKAQLENVYRNNWVARKIVDIPAFDSFREWRKWEADAVDVTALEATEKRLNLANKLSRAMQLGRLYGGGVILIGDGGSNPQRPLDTVDKDGIKYLHVLNRWEVGTGTDLNKDILSEFYDEPEFYELIDTNGRPMIKVHPSRIIKFLGAPVPDRRLVERPWSDSILQYLMDTVKNAASTQATIASLLHEVKLDVINIPGFTMNIVNDEYKKALQQRFMTADMMKSMFNVLLLDGGNGDGKSGEQWDRKQISFSDLPDVLQMYLLVASGAADIPATRLLGQSPRGMNATGESDIRNYYDKISAMQKVEITPSLNRLDALLFQSATGKEITNEYYSWNPLWQETATERAENAKNRADTSKVYYDTRLIPTAILQKAVMAQVAEEGVYPGFDKIIADTPTSEIEAAEKKRDEQMIELEKAKKPAPPPGEGSGGPPSRPEGT